MKLLDEFKEFAIKGNMIDIAIGVIIGAAFNKVIDVLVKGIFLPPLAYITDGQKWENRKFVLRKASESGTTKIDEIALEYGKLLETTVDFIVISITVFIIVKMMNSLRKRAQDVKDTSVSTPKEIELLSDIKSLLEKQNRS
ncbi:large conductance mechanosensitive channel protein MscL [Alteromonas ponticola]|uniref:Large-conductance mechanosensitive channel n=1 Tax=Alteromonas aquimaris TaxID=2998417 RepID=A0ABT3P9U6_9ALTE|nr:large conductance mechanosensitive channel protein MscL [Alteromonas aquimaris]MCW8109552.1 large conductance mechanosensitive channel protein MscL [Alteromonas aquimaris]